MALRQCILVDQMLPCAYGHVMVGMLDHGSMSQWALRRASVRHEGTSFESLEVVAWLAQQPHTCPDAAVFGLPSAEVIHQGSHAFDGCSV